MQIFIVIYIVLSICLSLYQILSSVPWNSHKVVPMAEVSICFFLTLYLCSFLPSLSLNYFIILSSHYYPLWYEQ